MIPSHFVEHHHHHKWTLCCYVNGLWSLNTIIRYKNVASHVALTKDYRLPGVFLCGKFGGKCDMWFEKANGMTSLYCHILTFLSLCLFLDKIVCSRDCDCAVLTCWGLVFSDTAGRQIPLGHSQWKRSCVLHDRVYLKPSACTACLPGTQPVRKPVSQSIHQSVSQLVTEPASPSVS